MNYDPRTQAILMLLAIQEDAWIANGCRKFKGYAQLQRIIEYLINTDTEAECRNS